jgi:group I intron endonuclease
MHVYQVTNLVNGKVYIGQHSKDNLTEYWQLYNVAYALRGCDGKPLLWRAIRKYGADSFVIRSLVCPVDKEQMDKLEIFFIRTMNSRNTSIGYNITAGGGGVLGVPLSQERRNNISAKQMGRIPWNKGRKCPEISAWMKGNKNGIGKRGSMPLSRRQQISQTLKTKGIRPSVEACIAGGRARQAADNG